MTIIFLTFDEWIKKNPDCNVMVDCDFCDGSGGEECVECGSDIDCKECDGTGERNIARDEYYKQLKKDEKKVDIFIKEQNK